MTAEGHGSHSQSDMGVAAAGAASNKLQLRLSFVFLRFADFHIDLTHGLILLAARAGSLLAGRRVFQSVGNYHLARLRLQYSDGITPSSCTVSDRVLVLGCCWIPAAYTAVLSTHLLPAVVCA